MSPPMCSMMCFLIREQSLNIGETGAEGNELGCETIAFAVTGVYESKAMFLAGV